MAQYAGDRHSWRGPYIRSHGRLVHAGVPGVRLATEVTYARQTSAETRRFSTERQSPPQPASAEHYGPPFWCRPRRMGIGAPKRISISPERTFQSPGGENQPTTVNRDRDDRHTRFHRSHKTAGLKRQETTVLSPVSPQGKTGRRYEHQEAP